LKALRGRIQSLEKNLSHTERSRSQARARLRETESAIAEANERLRALGAEKAAAESAQRAADERAARLAGRLRKLVLLNLGFGTLVVLAAALARYGH
ncbi:MAG TPA: hypothetical protein PLP08_14450, partial [Plasticicumulans sp.]|nr:hypothetical protein [Plasticicumulans sp.]